MWHFIEFKTENIFCAHVTWDSRQSKKKKITKKKSNVCLLHCRPFNLGNCYGSHCCFSILFYFDLRFDCFFFVECVRLWIGCVFCMCLCFKLILVPRSQWIGLLSTAGTIFNSWWTRTWNGCTLNMSFATAGTRWTATC